MKSIELLHEILARLPSSETGWVTCTRSDLTRTLCHHPKRPGSVTTADLDLLVPRLIAAGLACELPRPGKPPAYVFRPLTYAEILHRKAELQAAQKAFNAAYPLLVAQAEFSARVSSESRVLWTLGRHGQGPGPLNPLTKLGNESSTTREKTDVSLVSAQCPPVEAGKMPI